jgi:pyrimidine operon attenuation protein/uracil phosphoribosyltransferase
MAESRTPVLDHQAILVKIDRMACEICEKHTDSNRLILCGMNTRGFDIAGRMAAKIREILPELEVSLVHVDTHAAVQPVFEPATGFANEQVIVVDDVINTGKTLMHVLQEIFNQHPGSIETAFLAKREHRNYPVKADYVGISLATTLQEHVVFDNSNTSALEVYLN